MDEDEDQGEADDGMEGQMQEMSQQQHPEQEIQLQYGGQEIAQEGDEDQSEEEEQEVDFNAVQMINPDAEVEQEQQELAEDENEMGNGEDEEEELIDIDNLADNEKVVLWHYLSE